MVWRFTECWKEKSKSSRVFAWGKRAPLHPGIPAVGLPQDHVPHQPIARRFDLPLGRISWAGTHNRRLLNCQKRIIRLRRSNGGAR